MGKTGNLDELRKEIPEYERLRMKRVASNSARMEAAGFKTTIYMDLHNRSNHIASNVETSSNLSKDVDGPQVSANAWSLKEKEPTQLTQNLSMAEIMKSKYEKKSKRNLSTQAQQEGVDIEVDQVLTKEKSFNTKGSRCLEDQPSMMAKFLKRKSKNQSNKDLPTELQAQQRQSLEPQATGGGRMKQQPQERLCITPGSVGLYKNLLKMKKTQQFNSAAEKNCNESVIVNDVSHVDRTSFEEHEDGEEDPSNNANEVQVHEEAIVENASTVEAPVKKKHRGRSILTSLHKKIAKGRIEIVLNDKYQVVGDDETVSDFSHFLGLVAKNLILIPLNYPTWKYVPTKDRIWEHVKANFDINEKGKKFVMETISANWRLHKHRIKNATYLAFDTMKERLDNRPPEIPEKQYKELLKFWDLDIVKDISKKNRDNVSTREDYHTMGPKSFAMKRHLMSEEHPNNACPSQAELYIASRKRVPKRKYKTDPEPSQQNIEKLKEIISLPNRDGKGDPYYDVFTKKEHSGRLRLYGRGVTKTSLKEAEVEGRAPYVLPSKYMESVEKHLEQKITTKLLSQLKEQYPGIDLTSPNFTTPSTDDAHVGGSNEAITTNDEDGSKSDEENHQTDSQ